LKEKQGDFWNATQYIIGLMRSVSSRSLIALLIAFILLSLAGAFLWLHLATPSDGARLQPGESVWLVDGVVVTPLVDQPHGLQKGDVVLAVNGQSLETWAQALFQPGIQRPDWQFGETITYTVVRDGIRLEVPVTLGRYPLEAVLSHGWGTILFALIAQLIGTYVFLRRSNDQAARVLFLWASGILSATTWSFGLQVSDIVGGIGFWLFKATTFGAYMLFWVAGLHFALVFPKPLPLVSKYQKMIPWLYALPYSVYPLYLLAVLPGAPGTLAWIGRWTPGESFLALAYLAMMIWAMVVNYRRNRDTDSRRKMRWMLFAALLSGGGGIVLWLLPGLLLGRPLISTNALGLLVLPFPLAIAIAIIRHRLFDIDHIINRTAVYGALTTIVAALYVLVVGWFGNYLHARGAGPHTLIDLIVSLAATALVAVLFQPLREQLQRAVNRLMYGDREDPYAALTRLGQRLESDLAPDSVLQTIVETIASALKLPYAAITLREETSPAASFGEPPHNADLRAFPLQYQGERIGELLLAPRAADEIFTPSEERLLTDLARQAEAAVYNVRLTLDLRQSRERIVTSREEERRRIRRDLHDEIGPLLASQSLTLEAIEKLIAQDPAAAASLVRDLKGQTQGAVQEIRRIIYDLRPPALDDLGLVEALRERFAQLGQSRPVLSRVEGLRVELDAPEDLPSLSAAVETAVYRIAVEAVTNVIRHAEARECRVTLGVNGDLHLEISDDGAGLPAKYRAGVGLRAMQERAEELGGTFRIERGLGRGTRLLVKLPISAEGK